MKACSSNHPLLTRFTCTAVALVLALCFVPADLRCQTPAQKGFDAIHQMSSSFENLVKRVSPAVVEVLVSGYGSPNEDDKGARPQLAANAAWAPASLLIRTAIL